MNIPEMMEPFVKTFAALVAAEMRDFIKEELKNKNKEYDLSKLTTRAEIMKNFLPGISVSTWWRWEKAGRIKPYKIGRKVFYKPCEILESLESLKKYSRPVYMETVK